MKSLSFYNLKGGVGKTTSAVNLAFLASLEGKKVLLWDLDPQASASYYLKVDPEIKGGIKKLFTGEVEVGKHIRNTDYENLDILPGDFSMRNFDILLENLKKSNQRFSHFINQFYKYYDYLILDVPPGITLLSECIFQATDHIMMPVIPSPLSANAYSSVVNYFEEHDFDRDKLIPFFSLVDLRKEVHKEFMEELKKHDSSFLKNYIPNSSVIEKMGVYCAPLFAYTRSGPQVEAYLSLWKELKNRIR